MCTMFTTTTFLISILLLVNNYYKLYTYRTSHSPHVLYVDKFIQVYLNSISASPNSHQCFSKQPLVCHLPVCCATVDNNMMEKLVSTRSSSFSPHHLSSSLLAKLICKQRSNHKCVDVLYRGRTLFRFSLPTAETSPQSAHRSTQHLSPPFHPSSPCWSPPPPDHQPGGEEEEE